MKKIDNPMLESYLKNAGLKYKNVSSFFAGLMTETNGHILHILHEYGIQDVRVLRQYLPIKYRYDR